MFNPRLSPCCSVIAVLESVWINTNLGRKEIGTVQRCSNYKCQKIISDVKGGIKGSEWSMMLRYHPQPPYNFVKTAQGLVPETATQDAWKKPLQIAMAGQDRATEEHDPREDEV